MPDADKTPGQAVKQKSANELHSRNRERFRPLFFAILISEGHHAVFQRLDAAVGNGHPVCVAGQVFQHMPGIADRIAHIDDPGLFIQSGFQRIEVMIGKFEGLAGIFHPLHKLAAEHQRQHPRVEQVVSFAGYPA